jgi:hypothetical protein
MQLDEARGLIGLQLRLLAAQAPLGFRHLHPSPRVRIRIRSASATMASTLNSSRPTGSVGSWTDPPRLSFTFPLVGSSPQQHRADRAVGPQTIGQPSISIELFMFAP